MHFGADARSYRGRRLIGRSPPRTSSGLNSFAPTTRCTLMHYEFRALAAGALLRTQKDQKDVLPNVIAASTRRYEWLREVHSIVC